MDVVDWIGFIGVLGLTGDFAGVFVGYFFKLLIWFGLWSVEERATPGAIDWSLRLRLCSDLRQSGGRFAAVFIRGAEAPLYLRSKCNGRGKYKRNCKYRDPSLRSG